MKWALAAVALVLLVVGGTAAYITGSLLRQDFYVRPASDGIPITATPPPAAFATPWTADDTLRVVVAVSDPDGDRKGMVDAVVAGLEAHGASTDALTVFDLSDPDFSAAQDLPGAADLYIWEGSVETEEALDEAGRPTCHLGSPGGRQEGSFRHDLQLRSLDIKLAVDTLRHVAPYLWPPEQTEGPEGEVSGRLLVLASDVEAAEFADLAGLEVTTISSVDVEDARAVVAAELPNGGFHAVLVMGRDRKDLHAALQEGFRLGPTVGVGVESDFGPHWTAQDSWPAYPGPDTSSDSWAAWACAGAAAVAHAAGESGSPAEWHAALSSAIGELEWDSLPRPPFDPVFRLSLRDGVFVGRTVVGMVDATGEFSTEAVIPADPPLLPEWQPDDNLIVVAAFVDGSAGPEQVIAGVEAAGGDAQDVVVLRRPAGTEIDLDGIPAGADMVIHDSGGAVSAALGRSGTPVCRWGIRDSSVSTGVYLFPTNQERWRTAAAHFDPEAPVVVIDGYGTAAGNGETIIDVKQDPLASALAESLTAQAVLVVNTNPSDYQAVADAVAELGITPAQVIVPIGNQPYYPEPHILVKSTESDAAHWGCGAMVAAAHQQGEPADVTSWVATIREASASIDWPRVGYSTWASLRTDGTVERLSVALHEVIDGTEGPPFEIVIGDPG